MVMAPQPSASQTEGAQSPAGTQGSTSVTSANRSKTHRGQLSLVNSDPERILQHASGRAPQCPPAEPQTWKDFRVNLNNTGQLPLPLYGHESGYVPPSCPPCTMCSQIQEWKLFHKSKSTDSKFITGACIPI